MSFDKVNCSEMPPSSNVLVQGFLKQYLGEKRKVFAHVLDDYRKEYKTWLENKPFYEAETRARQLLAQDLAEAGETQSYTNLNRLGSIRDDEERGLETGSGPTGDHSSNSRS
jgi:predicted RNA-binding protein